MIIIICVQIVSLGIIGINCINGIIALFVTSTILGILESMVSSYSGIYATLINLSNYFGFFFFFLMMFFFFRCTVQTGCT